MFRLLTNGRFTVTTRELLLKFTAGNMNLVLSQVYLKGHVLVRRRQQKRPQPATGRAVLTLATQETLQLALLAKKMWFTAKHVSKTFQIRYNNEQYIRVNTLDYTFVIIGSIHYFFGVKCCVRNTNVKFLYYIILNKYNKIFRLS